MRNELNYITIQNKFKLYYNTLIYKSLHGLSPSYLSDMFVSNHNIHNYNTRARLYVSGQNRVFSNLSFSLHGPLAYNLLPVNIKNSSNVNIFKNSLTQFYKAQEQGSSEL